MPLWSGFTLNSVEFILSIKFAKIDNEKLAELTTASENSASSPISKEDQIWFERAEYIAVIVASSVRLLQIDNVWMRFQSKLQDINGAKLLTPKFHSDYLLRDSVRHTGDLRVWPPTHMASTDFGGELEGLRGRVEIIIATLIWLKYHFPSSGWNRKY